MGTNYYLVKPEKRCGECGHVSGQDKIHIGKSSVGWHFGFDSRERRTVAEWEAFILKWLDEGGWIADEYDSESRVSPEDFWKMIEAKKTQPECMARHGATCAGGVDFCPWEFS